MIHTPTAPARPRALSEKPPFPREDRLAPRAVPSMPRPRLPFIDGLRGLAMLMVLSFHCWQSCGTLAPIPGYGWHRTVTLLLRHGYLGVHLFLVLSGFCLTYPLAREGAARMRLDLRRFFQRRAWRILPPYYIALTAFCLFPVLEAVLRTALGRPRRIMGRYTTAQLLSHLFMIHNFSPAWVRSINGSFWSLALEWQLYMLFPLLVWGFRRWGPARTLTGVLIASLAYRSWVYALHVGDGSWPLAMSNVVGCWLAYGQVPGRMFEFTMGMLAALAMADRREVPSPPLASHPRFARVPGSCPRRYLAGFFLFGLLAFGVALGWSSFSPITDILWGLAFFCLVMYAGERSTAGGGWLESRPLTALGTISYSVYLIHEPLIRIVDQLLHRHYLSPLTAGAIYTFGVAPLMIGLGWLYYHAVEARFTRAGIQTASHRATAAVGAQRRTVARS